MDNASGVDTAAPMDLLQPGGSALSQMVWSKTRLVSSSVTLKMRLGPKHPSQAKVCGCGSITRSADPVKPKTAQSREYPSLAFHRARTAALRAAPGHPELSATAR
jgi:hypothetical protein